MLSFPPRRGLGADSASIPMTWLEKSTSAGTPPASRGSGRSGSRSAFPPHASLFPHAGKVLVSSHKLSVPSCFLKAHATFGRVIKMRFVPSRSWYPHAFCTLMLLGASYVLCPHAPCTHMRCVPFCVLYRRASCIVMRFCTLMLLVQSSFLYRHLGHRVDRANLGLLGACVSWS